LILLPEEFSIILYEEEKRLKEKMEKLDVEDAISFGLLTFQISYKVKLNFLLKNQSAKFILKLLNLKHSRTCFLN
jgi:hypothetical protein